MIRGRTCKKSLIVSACGRACVKFVAAMDDVWCKQESSGDSFILITDIQRTVFESRKL